MPTMALPELSGTAAGTSGRGAILAQDAEQPELERRDSMEAIPSDQGTVSAIATKAVSPLSGVASYRYAVNHLLTSVVRENRTLRSAGAGGGRLPLATRWRASQLLIIWLLQQAPIGSVEACPDRHSPKRSASFSPTLPRRKPASDIWQLVGGRMGFTCPRCGHTKAYELVNQRRHQCWKCRYQVSLTSGTILHRTKIPLTYWFWAAYLMTTDKRGVSALLLQRQLGLTCYETAWMMLHKLRRAMVNAAREPLRGEVEVDETWIGGEQAGLRGSRQLKQRRAALVLVAVEKRGRASGRVRMSVIPDFKAVTIMSFLTEHIASGATIYTDGLKSFSGLVEAGFKHVARSQPLRSQLRQGAKSAVPLADRAIGNLQQWLIGTYHGVSK